jgi:hypothetical protein
MNASMAASAVRTTGRARWTVASTTASRCRGRPTTVGIVIASVTSIESATIDGQRRRAAGAG